MHRLTGRGGSARALTAAGVAAVVLVGVGAVAAYASTRTDSPTYRTATVGKQDVQQVLQTTGTIEPGTSATVTFPVSGTVATVRVAMGSRVARGEVLATLDRTTLSSAVASARLTLAQAELTLHQATTGQTSTSARSSSSSGSSGSSAASSASRSATAALTRSQQQLLGTVRQADQALGTVKTDLALATTLCGTATTPPSSPPPSTGPTPPSGPAAPTTCAQAQQVVLTDETAVLALQQTVSTQEAALDRLLAKASRTTSTSVPRASSSGSGSSGGSGSTAVSAAQLAADQADVDAAAAALVLAEQQLAQAVMVSPMDGVVSSLGLVVGHEATAGSSSSAVDVIGTDAHQVTLSVDVAKVPSVKVGQKAAVVPDGTGTTLAATVAFVGAAPSTTGGSAYTVRLSFTGAPAGLRDGIQAAVTLVVGDATDALAVPTSAVHHLGSITYVTLVSAGTTTRQVVTVGVVGPLWTQVVRGLSAGQQVMIADVTEAIPTATTSSRFARFAGAGGLGGLGGGGFVQRAAGG